jgi:hypothetical protein
MTFNLIDPWWLEYCISCYQTGSQVICNPPPGDSSDDDYILLVDTSILDKFNEVLRSNGFTDSSDKYRKHSVNLLKAYPHYRNIFNRDQGQGLFQSYRKDSINLIITCCEEYYSNFCKATYLARYLNLEDKEERVAVFEAICSDIWPIEMKAKRIRVKGVPGYLNVRIYD